MLLRAAAVPGAGLVGRARQAGADARATGAWSCGLGFCGYYLASFLDFAGLQYISASLERLILYLNPTLVLLLGVLLFKRRVTRAATGWRWRSATAGVLLVFGHEVTLAGHATWRSARRWCSAARSAMRSTWSTAARRCERLGALRLTGLATTVACVLCIVQFLRAAAADARWPWRPR